MVKPITKELETFGWDVVYKDECSNQNHLSFIKNLSEFLCHPSRSPLKGRMRAIYRHTL